MTTATNGTAQWVAVIEDAAARYKLNPALVEAIMSRESGGNARALGAAGEIGLMQLHPKGAIAAWESGHLKADYWDAWTNVNVACWFLADLTAELRRRGLPAEWADLVLAYNAGMAYNVNRSKPVPASTQAYIKYVEARFRANVWPKLVADRQASRPVVPTTPVVVKPDATAVDPSAPLHPGPPLPWEAPEWKLPPWLLPVGACGVALIVAFRELRGVLGRH